jgi:hypothetical protein
VLHDGGRAASIDHVAVLPKRLVRDVRARALVIWAAVRLFLLIFAFVVGYPLFGPVVYIWVVVICSALLAADLRVSRETMLIANLGLRRARVVAIAAPRLLLLEGAAQLFVFAAYELVPTILQ